MAKAIHFKCISDEAGQPRGVSFDPVTKIFWSGDWDISPEDTHALVGGWLYLHETKAAQSYYGGPITGFVEVTLLDKAHSKRIKFQFRPSFLAKGKEWRGRNDTNAWTSNLVEGTMAHELEDSRA